MFGTRCHTKLCVFHQSPGKNLYFLAGCCRLAKNNQQLHFPHMVAQIKKHPYCLCYCTLRKLGGCVTDNVSKPFLICAPSRGLGLSFNSGDRSYIINQNMTSKRYTCWPSSASRGCGAVLRIPTPANSFISSGGISFCLLISSARCVWCARVCRSLQSWVKLLFHTWKVLFSHVKETVNDVLFILIENKGTWHRISPDYLFPPFIHCFMLLQFQDQ